MNKVVKRKLIGSIMCIVLAICILVYLLLNHTNINENLQAYLRGFTGGVLGVGLVTMAIVIRAIINPKKGAELENTVKDERLISINDRTMAITFKVIIMLQAVISIVSAFTQNMIVAEYIGFAICVELIVYLITYIFVKRNN